MNNWAKRIIISLIGGVLAVLVSLPLTLYYVKQPGFVVQQFAGQFFSGLIVTLGAQVIGGWFFKDEQKM